jgi:four helix bundle protein
MRVRRFQDLVAWQLCYTLKCEVVAFTAMDPVSRDFDFCDQIRDSSRSATRNIAEGFGRCRPRDAARYYEIAYASIVETRNHLIDARDSKYLDDALFRRLFNLAGAAERVTKNLMLSAKRCRGQLPWE